MKIPWTIALCLAVGGISGFIGHRMGVNSVSADTPSVDVAGQTSAPEPDPFAAEPPSEIGPSDEEIEALLTEMAADADEAQPTGPPQFDAERMRHWENMSMEQRRMLRKSMFSALAKIDGLEELGDAMRQGKVDPRTSSIRRVRR